MENEKLLNLIDKHLNFDIEKSDGSANYWVNIFIKRVKEEVALEEEKEEEGNNYNELIKQISIYLYENYNKNGEFDEKLSTDEMRDLIEEKLTQEFIDCDMIVDIYDEMIDLNLIKDTDE